jgi:hypothetical protein
MVVVEVPQVKPRPASASEPGRGFWHFQPRLQPPLEEGRGPSSRLPVYPFTVYRCVVSMMAEPMPACWRMVSSAAMSRLLRKRASVIWLAGI